MGQTLAAVARNTSFVQIARTLARAIPIPMAAGVTTGRVATRPWNIIGIVTIVGTTTSEWDLLRF